MNAEQPHIDPLGELIHAGLELERANLAAIERLSAEVIRLTRKLGTAQEIHPSVRAHMRVAAVVECSCCADCGAVVPCSESIEGDGCVDQCVCLAPKSH
jgi:hypothetical protein